MRILIAFAPFLTFALIDRLGGVMAGLAAATLVSAGMLIRDAVTPGRGLKVLEIGTLILFGGLAAYTRFTAPDWTILDVRLRVDTGLLLIVLLSMALRQPFTLQYAREGKPPEVWQSPEFLQVNYRITAAWAAAFALMVAADVAMRYFTDLPQSVGIGVTVAAIYGAMRFTTFCTDRPS